jgi:hypothetical protein
MEEISPIRSTAGKNITEPKEKPPNEGVFPLEFSHWRLLHEVPVPSS